MPTTNKTPNQMAREEMGTAAPFTLAQNAAWAESRARFAHEAAGRWIESSHRHQRYAREAERFEAVARELHRLRAIDAAAG